MDRRLLKAAQIGDVQALHQLLRENPLVIHTTALASSDNLLHVAAALGHFDIAKEILRLKPAFWKELNHDGYSPMHIAAANGHVEIVKDMLNNDPSLCCLQGREKLTPLHCAAIKGKANVINEMLSSCARCASDVNVQRETALHLAVKNNQFEATRVMVEWIRQKRKHDIFNMMDEKGNTVLHLATWRKQRQVVELLLQEQATLDMLDINAINHSGLTALDLLLIFPSEAGDQEIAEILQLSGARKARDIACESHNGESENNRQYSETSQEHHTDLLDYFRFRKGRDSPGEARSILLMIAAALAATATFQAGVNLPGGYWQEQVIQNRNNGTTTANEMYLPGTSILADRDATGYNLFVLFNSTGFYFSLIMIRKLISKFPLCLEFALCILAMLLSYNNAVVNTPRDRAIIIAIQVVFAPIPPYLVGETTFW